MATQPEVAIIVLRRETLRALGREQVRPQEGHRDGSWITSRVSGALQRNALHAGMWICCGTTSKSKESAVATR